MKYLQGLLLAGAALLFLLLPSMVRADTPTTTTSVLLPTINAERWASGLGPVIVDPFLERVAMDRLHFLYGKSSPTYNAMSHCVDVSEGFTEHCQSGLEAAQRLPPRIWWGENLALIYGYGVVVNSDAGREWALRLWWFSLPHRANTLGKHFTKVGTAEKLFPSGDMAYEELYTQ